jgi:hypothetical protein
MTNESVGEASAQTPSRGDRVWFTHNSKIRPGTFISMEGYAQCRTTLDDAEFDGVGLEHVVYVGNIMHALDLPRRNRPMRADKPSAVGCMGATSPTTSAGGAGDAAGGDPMCVTAPYASPTVKRAFTREQIVRRLYLTHPGVLARAAAFAESDPKDPDGSAKRLEKALKRAWELSGGLMRPTHQNEAHAPVEVTYRRECEERVDAMFAIGHRHAAQDEHT